MNTYIQAAGESLWLILLLAAPALLASLLVGLLVSLPIWLVSFPNGLMRLTLRRLSEGEASGLLILAPVIPLALGFALVSGLLSGLGTTPEERLALGQDAERLIHDDLVSGLMAGIVWLGVWLTIGPFMAFADSLSMEYRLEEYSPALLRITRLQQPY